MCDPPTICNNIGHLGLKGMGLLLGFIYILFCLPSLAVL